MSLRDFTCPISCLTGVGDVWGGSDEWSGQYDFKIKEVAGTPVVLDIGANAGSYALKALIYWEACHKIQPIIHAYEPDPAIFDYLQRNCSPRIICHNQAVGDPTLTWLNRGGLSPCCSSQYPLDGEPAGRVAIQVLPPEELPVANIVKIDAEGAESYIIERMKFVPALMAVEWHDDWQRVCIENSLAGKMYLVNNLMLARGRGVLKFAKI